MHLVLGNYFLVALTFTAIIFASWCISEGGKILGQKYDASIIGGLFIAWLNTAPETIFFVSSLICKQPRFAIGAISGSTLVVSTIVTGICFYLGSRARVKKRIKLQKSVKNQALILGFSSIIPFLISVYGVNYLFAFFGIASYIIFLLYTIYYENNNNNKNSGSTSENSDPNNNPRVAINFGDSSTSSDFTKSIFSSEKSKNDIILPLIGIIRNNIYPLNQFLQQKCVTIYDNEVKDFSYKSENFDANDSIKQESCCLSDSLDSDSNTKSYSKPTLDNESILKGFIFLIIGGLLILFSSRPFIISLVNIAHSLNLNPLFLAFFLTPIASEMPEILESISLSREGNSKDINIVFSNLVGGTTTKTTLLMGILSFYGKFYEFVWISPNYTFSMMFIVTSAVVTGIIGGFTKYQTKIHAYILFSTFFCISILQYYFNNNFVADLELPIEET